MITMSILAVLGVALAFVLWAMFRAPSGPRPVAAAAARQVDAALPENLDAWDAKVGDVISIAGAAADFSDLDFPVDRRSSYQASNRRWVDLSGNFRGDRVYLEVYRHPQPEWMGIFDARKLTLTDLGLNEDGLAAMDQRQDPSDVLEFEGKKWHWESSREIQYFENDLGGGEGLYRWIFREPEGNRLLCIEKWEGEPFEARIARRLNQRDITVYRAGAPA